MVRGSGRRNRGSNRRDRDSNQLSRERRRSGARGEDKGGEAGCIGIANHPDQALGVRSVGTCGAGSGHVNLDLWGGGGWKNVSAQLPIDDRLVILDGADVV